MGWFQSPEDEAYEKGYDKGERECERSDIKDAFKEGYKDAINFFGHDDVDDVDED